LLGSGLALRCGFFAVGCRALSLGWLRRRHIDCLVIGSICFGFGLRGIGVGVVRGVSGRGRFRTFQGVSGRGRFRTFRGVRAHLIASSGVESQRIFGFGRVGDAAIEQRLAAEASSDAGRGISLALSTRPSITAEAAGEIGARGTTKVNCRDHQQAGNQREGMV
jgi:hypothetical protein